MFSNSLFSKKHVKEISLLLFLSELDLESPSVAAARPNQKNKITKTNMMAKAFRISVMVYLTLFVIKVGRPHIPTKYASSLLFLKSCNNG